MLGRSVLGGPAEAIRAQTSLVSGFNIPILGFGTYRMTPPAAYSAVRHALRVGYRHFDCAKAYGNESSIGRALEDGLQEMRLRRGDIFVCSKLWSTDHRPDRVEKACQTTIDRLRVGYLDLYLVHWPCAWVPVAASGTAASAAASEMYKTTEGVTVEADAIEEELHPLDPATGFHRVDESVTLPQTWAAMQDLTRKDSAVAANGLGAADCSFGYNMFPTESNSSKKSDRTFEPLVRSIGFSNFSKKDIETVYDSETMQVPSVCNQIELHPGCPQSLLKQINGQYQLATVAYCPLGMPTRFTDKDFTGVVNDPFFKFFEPHIGFKPARMILNWSVDSNNIVVVKAQTPAHIEANAKVQRHTLRDSQRWFFDQYYTLRPVRVINPVGFRGDGEKFFQDEMPERAKPELVKAYEEAVREVEKQTEKEQKENKEAAGGESDE